MTSDLSGVEVAFRKTSPQSGYDTCSHSVGPQAQESSSPPRRRMPRLGKALLPRFALVALVLLIIGCAASPSLRRFVARRWSLRITVIANLLGWYAVSMSITFTNKHLLTDRGFEFPFALSMATNFFVFLLVFAATRPRALRPPSLPWATVVRVVGPIGILTALDIGCSNWALVHLSVAFHTILRGTVPVFVLCFSLTMGLEKPSLLIGASVLMVVLGCALAAYAEISCDFFGLALALLSCVFSGLRWALTQLLVHLPTSGAACGGGSSSSSSVSSGGTVPGGSGAGSPGKRSRRAEAAKGALDRGASPLSSMFYVTPACSFSSGVAAFIMERDAIYASNHLFAPRLRGELCWYIGATGTLVFVLLFCEFGLVRLTSSLSLSVFGVLKELITIVLAATARGDNISPTNILGFGLCSAGVLLYQSASSSGKGGTKTVSTDAHAPRTPIVHAKQPRAESRGKSEGGKEADEEVPPTKGRSAGGVRTHRRTDSGELGEMPDEAAASAGFNRRGTTGVTGAAAAPAACLSTVSSACLGGGVGGTLVSELGAVVETDDEDGSDEEDNVPSDHESENAPAGMSWSTSGFWGAVFANQRKKGGDADENRYDPEDGEPDFYGEEAAAGAPEGVGAGAERGRLIEK